MKAVNIHVFKLHFVMTTDNGNGNRTAMQIEPAGGFNQRMLTHARSGDET
jgi:hypothetical protein